MADHDRGSDWTLLYIAMIYVGLFMFLWGFIGPRATRGATKFLGFVAIMLMFIGATMWVYDTGSARKKTTSILEAVTVRVPKANVRTEPSTLSNKTILGKVLRGTTLPATSLVGRWYRVSFEGQDAYIHQGIVRKQVRYETRSTRKWPNLPVAMAVFAGLYVCAVIDSYRQHARLMRSMA